MLVPPTFDPLRHPRGKDGRFTKSSTVLASAKEKREARSIVEGLKPANRGDSMGYAAKIADPGQADAARTFAADSRSINQGLRDGKTEAPGVKAMDAAMRPLPDDVVLHRKVPATAFGGVDPQSLQGMKVRDAGYSATQLDPAAADKDVHLFIAAPAGSRAVVNADTGEVYLDRDSEMVVTHVETNSAGGHDMYLTLLPKQGAASKAKPAGEKAGAANVGEKAPTKPEAGKPAGADEFRAQLMKQKVADLQSQMRDRGFKPGRKRKSELVDALVADETGRDKPAKPEAAKAEPGSPAEPGKHPAADKATGMTSAEDQVRAAVADVVKANGGADGDWVNIADVRDRLPDMNPAEFDAAVKALHKQPGVNVERNPDPFALSPADHDAAVTIAGEPRHLIAIQKPADLAEPTREADKPGSGALAAAPIGLDRPDGAGKLTPQMRRHLVAYRSGSDVINAALRKPGAEVPAAQRHQIAGVDKAMAASKLTADVQVFRGVRQPETFFGDRMSGDLTGMTWREDAYVSTSAVQKVAQDFAQDRRNAEATGMVMHITVPAGVGGVEISPATFEGELLLDRGHNFRVVKDHGVVGGTRVIDVEVLPKEPA